MSNEIELNECRKAVIREMENWTKVWQKRFLSRYDDSIKASATIKFNEEPAHFVINEEEHVVQTATLKAFTEPVRNLRISIECEGSEDLFQNVIAHSPITKSVKEEIIGMGISLLQASLDSAQIALINSGPTQNELANWFLRFM